MPFNYSNHIDASMDIRAPASQRIRADMGPYPGGVSVPTDRMLAEPGLNKQFSQTTNDTVKISVHTRTRDQRNVNAQQLVFMDTEVFDKPRLLSVQQLNRYLLENPRASKVDIKDRFKLLGVVMNTDADTATNVERIARTFTCAVRGDVHVMDYWSTATNTLRRYDLCYLVLRRVHITADYTTQIDLGSALHNTGMPPPAAAVGDWRWQVVPHSVKDRHIRVEDYTSAIPMEGTDVTFKEIGTYWRVGFTHEYASIGDPGHFEKRRDENCTARDITYLHDSGRLRPMQFYLWLDDGTKGI